MKLLCITGHSGSGKSTIANRIVSNFDDAVIIDIDTVVHKTLRNKGVKEQVFVLFGKEVFNAGGNINRKLLGKIVFANQKLNRQLCDLTWVFVEDYINNVFNEQHKLVILDWFMISGKSYWEKSNCNVLVTCGADARKRRVLARDDISEEYFKSREKNKCDYNDLKFDFIINSDSSPESTVDIINRICEFLISKKC